MLLTHTLARARSLGVDAGPRLEANDGHGFFKALGNLVVSSSTRTNVNDYRAIVLA